MKIVIAGGSGFVGGPLVQRLRARGDDVTVLSRDAAKGLQWDAKSQGPWSDVAANADVVINLAGENVGDGRWTDERKRRIVDSRLNATNVLVEAMRRNPSKARTFINASATGIYGYDRGDETFDENGTRGGGFLADVVSKWEAAASAAEPIARLVILRFGVVLADDGGALAKMILPFKLGAGGPVGSGQQWMSWVEREDVLRFVEWAIDQSNVRGVYNVTAPNPVRNRDFARALGRAVHRPSFMPAPAFALRAAFGRGLADEVLLGGQRVLPARAVREGFAFQSTEIDGALQRAVG